MSDFKLIIEMANMKLKIIIIYRHDNSKIIKIIYLWMLNIIRKLHR